MISINCDLCGKVSHQLNRALIEGVELNVCLGCSKFGKVLAPMNRDTFKTAINIIENKKERIEEKIELLVEDYAAVIKKGRESMGLSQKDFAGRINEKESAIHKVETGALEPSFQLAKKLEKALGVKLIEEFRESRDKFKRKKEEGFTLGDFMYKNKKLWMKRSP